MELPSRFPIRRASPWGRRSPLTKALETASSRTLVRAGRIELRNFGVFEVRKWEARKGRNPRTGAVVAVPEHLAISFKAGLAMQERVEQLKRPSVR